MREERKRDGRARKREKESEIRWILLPSLFFLLESVVARNVDRDAITFRQLYITVYIYIYLFLSVKVERDGRVYYGYIW